MLDFDRLATATLDVVKALLSKELAPLRAENEVLRDINAKMSEEVAALSARIEALEEVEQPQFPQFEELLEQVEQASSAAGAASQQAELARISAEQIGIGAEKAIKTERARVEDFVRTAIAAIPAPPAISIEEISEKTSAAIKAAIDSIPPAPSGRDGLGIAEVKQNDDGELIVKMTNGETINAGRVRGADGFGFEDLSVDFDGEREIVLRFSRGDEVRAFPIALPIPIDRGVWADGKSYARGDAVTWAGSVWIAQKDAPEGKPELTADWRLAVKRGRDAKPKVTA